MSLMFVCVYMVSLTSYNTVLDEVKVIRTMGL